MAQGLQSSESSAHSSSVNYSPLSNDSIDYNLKQASRYLAQAVAGLRVKGDNEYAAIIQSKLHGLERPYWLAPPDPKDPVLPRVS